MPPACYFRAGFPHPGVYNLLSKRVVESSMAEDDEVLIIRCRTDRAAFETLFRRHYRQIFLFARNILGSEEEADEAAQDVLLKIYRAADTFKQGFRFTPWMYQIASNHCKNILRHRQTDRRHVEELEPSDDIVPAPPETPLEIYARRDLRERITEAINSLSGRYREVFHLRYLAGMSYKEIAQTLGVSVSAVETRILRGKAMLREKLTHMGVSPA